MDKQLIPQILYLRSCLCRLQKEIDDLGGGGGGSTPNFDQVLTQGNTTTQSFSIQTSGAADIVSVGANDAHNGIITVKKDDTTIYTSVIPGYIVVNNTSSGNSIQVETDKLNFKSSSSDSDLLFDNLTSAREWELPDNNGILALTQNTNGAIVNTSDNFANDAAAATGGIAVGQLYHTSGTVKVRLT